MTPAFLFLGSDATDLAVLAGLLAELSATPVRDVPQAMRLLRDGRLSAMIIGTDVSLHHALRLVRLVRAVQPSLPIIYCGTDRSTELQACVTRTVPRAWLAAAICGVLLPSVDDSELLPSYRRDLLRRRRQRARRHHAAYLARVRRAALAGIEQPLRHAI